MMDTLTAVTARMRCTAENPLAAQHSFNAHTATNACRRSGSVMVKQTAKMAQMRR